MDIELIKAAQEAMQSCGNSQVKAAKMLGIARSSLQNRLRKAAQSGNDGLAFKPVPFGHTVKGVSTYYDADGVPRGQWLKTKTDQPNIEDLVEYFKDAFSSFEGKSSSFELPYETQNNELLTLYPVPDIHHGLLSWGEETGEDWDIKKSQRVVFEVFSQLVSQSKPSEQAIILNLGDFFHSDDFRNMTPRSGHILDVDTRYTRMIQTGVYLMINLIELALEKHESVLVRNLPGNHDYTSVVALTVALSAYYRNNSRVTIDDDPSEFWFYLFGNTLFGANHGHRLKPVDMAIKLACERAEDWGKSKYRHFFFGHFHHNQSKEVGNVLCESFNTVVAKDAHAANGGYMSGRSLNALTFHKERGEIGRHKVNL